MKTIFLTILLACSSALCGSGFIHDETITQSELNQNDQKGLDHIKQDKTTKRMKIISLDKTALAGRTIEINLFDGEKGDFEITKISEEGGDSLWSGTLSNKPQNNDRISIRKVSGIFSGYVFLKGRMYEMHPVDSKTYVIVERDMNFGCGSGISKETKSGDSK